MAENVAVTTLEIRGTEKVATTMKELKQQITDYRNELVALGQIEDKTEEQMERQEEVVKKLQKATKLLTDVTNAHKKSAKDDNKEVDIANDSYNALQKRLTELKKAYKDMTSAERESDLGKETLQNISALDTKLKDLDAGMGVYSRNVGNYGQTFEEAMNKARQSSGYMAQGLGTITSAMGLLGVQNESATKTIQLLALAFQAFTNEGVTKAIVKLKDWITAKRAASAASKTSVAETQAMSGAMKAEAAATTTATTATNLFKKALIATGIGAIIVLIGTLIASWDDLTDSVGRSAKEQKKHIEDMEREMERSIVIMEARGATQAEVMAAEIQNMRTLIDEYLELVDIEASKWFGDVEEAVDAVREAQEKLNDKMNESKALIISTIRGTKDFYDARNLSEYERKVKDINNTYESMKNLVMEITWESSAQRNAMLGAVEVWKKLEMEMADEAEAERKRQEAAEAAAAAEAEKEAAINKKRAAEREEWSEEQRALAEEEAYWKEQSEAQVDAILAPIEAQKEADAEAQRLREEREAAMMEEVRLMNEAAMEEMATQEALIEKQRELTEAKKEAALASADATSNLLSSIADAVESFGAENEKSQKAAKGIKVAATTIETISGATSAYMSAQTLPPPYGQIVGAANAAAVLATGIANIAKIKAITPGSSISSLGDTAISANVSAPNIPTNLQSTHNVTSSSEEELLNRMAQPQRVYILQSDIEAAGSVAKAQVAESSF
jgi:hypothetical protein